MGGRTNRSSGQRTPLTRGFQNLINDLCGHGIKLQTPAVETLSWRNDLPV
jgi:hypothetical protein